MSNELVKSEIENIIGKVKNILNEEITEENAFEYLAMQLFCYKINTIENKLFDIKSSITNGPNDGGIDFVYFDDEEMKVVVGQCKYTEIMKLNDVISELNKMSSTVENFKVGNTGAYNETVKRNLQNALDQLSEENVGNVEYWIFTTTSFNENELYNKIQQDHNLYSKDMVNVFDIDDVNSKIKEFIENINTVDEFKVKIDKPKNVLHYETDKVSGIMVNISSYSLTQMYNKYKDDGLFDLNIRKYIRNKAVDDGIKEKLDKERGNFLFYNNGLTIACNEFILDGDNVKIYDFSIVNGGQTTNRIGNYKGNNLQEFYIPCKIISIKKDNPRLYTKIAEATNSQKPIYGRDLKSNSPEMRMLQNWLDREGIYLEIKRGEKSKKAYKYKIKNDELGQLILSFAYQQPGTARSGKKNIFENNALYNKIYRVNYEKDKNKKDFIIDLIKLSENYTDIESYLKNSNEINEEDKIILSNARFIVFALLGLSYFIVNGDYTRNDIYNDVDLIKEPNINYGKFISNYKKDDYMENLKSLILIIIDSLSTTYESCIKNGSITSISNLFKTDKKYRENIVTDFLKTIERRTYIKEYEQSSSILKR